MTGFEVDSNATQLATQLAAAAGELSDLEPVNRRAGELIAAAPGPRRTGATLAGVRALTTATTVTVASVVRNFTFTHWGAPGRHVKAQPWLAEYVDTHTDDLLDLYSDHASEVLAQVNG